LLKKLGVVHGFALSVFSSHGGDSRFSVGRHNYVRRDGGFAALLHHDFVGAGVDLRKCRSITIWVTCYWVILAVELAAGFPTLSLAIGKHEIDRVFCTALKRFPF